MSDVFLSYSVKSAGKLASQIAAALESAGISCWYAERDMSPGLNFAGSIVQQIQNCRVFLLILDKQSVNSLHVQTETMMAFERLMKDESFQLIPFRVDECELSDSDTMRYYLVHTQILNGYPPTDERIQELTYRIAEILGRESLASPKPRAHKNPKLRDTGTTAVLASPKPRAHKNARVASAIKGWFSRILNR